MTHLMDLLINTLVILVGLFVFAWLAAGPLVGKI